jgi:hypothetical protein
VAAEQAGGCLFVDGAYRPLRRNLEVRVVKDITEL